MPYELSPEENELDPIATWPAGDSRSGGASLLLNLTDGDGAGPYTITYPSSVEFPGGNAVTEVSQNGNIEVALRSPDGGTTFRATATEDYS